MVSQTRSVPVPIIGIGWQTALGGAPETVWERLCAGQDGFREISFEQRVRNEKIAVGEDYDAAMPLRQRLLDLAERAARKAIEDSGLEEAERQHIQLIAGTSLGHFLDEEGDSHRIGAWADELGHRLGLVKPPISLSTACSSGADAIALGATLIRQGAAKLCLCGGADIITPSKRLGHTALGTMSPSRCRPFDSQHDGMLLGEGAGFLVLVDNECDHTATVHSKLLGCGAANDAASLTAPDASCRAAKLAIHRALDDAGLDVEAIGAINAHGSGTLLNDSLEATTYTDLFGHMDTKPVAVSTKGAFGHTLGATGALEAITLIQSLNKGISPPTVGLENPLPEFPLPLSSKESLPLPKRTGLSLTLGFGGYDTCLIFAAS